MWAGWKKIAAKIAHVQGHLLLGIVYILVAAPTSLLLKLLKKDPLALKDEEQASYWWPRDPAEPPPDFLKSQS